MGAAIRERSEVRKLVHSPILVYYIVQERERLIEIVHIRHGSRRPARL